MAYVEGQNLAIEYRFELDQSKSYDELAQELIRFDPAAIVLTGTPAALALKRQTTTIPIVLAPIADPLALGLARSLARPGGNVTGVTMCRAENPAVSTVHGCSWLHMATLHPALP